LGNRYVVVAAALVIGALLPTVAHAQLGLFTPAEKQQMLDAHNQVRATVNPPALVMPPLTWSVALELTAQTWASRCNLADTNGDGGIDHNPGRSLLHPYYVGENIADAPAQISGPMAVQAWAGERFSYDFATNTCRATIGCGHYKQVVAANTLELGCARVYCPTLLYSWAIVCNYGPGANTSARPYDEAPIFADGFES
jgi:pathogenesis-related protein 1